MSTVALTLLLLGLALLLCLKCTKIFKSNHSRNIPLPPGPKRLPLWGNAFNIPTMIPWKTYAEWTQQYGDIIFMQVFGQPFVVLNSIDSVVDLLEKRSSNYSDRTLPEMVKLMGLDWNFAFIRYGPLWRRHRRGFHQFMNQTAIQEYEPVQREGARNLLRRLYAEPKKFAHHIRYTFGASALAVSHGIRAADKDDEIVAATERALEGSTDAVAPERYWVNYIPLLKYIPAWVPGAEFQRKAVRVRVDAIATKEMSWNNITRAGPYKSLAIKLLERISHLDGEAYAQEEDVAKNTVSALHCFFLAMTLYPEAQRRAQEELASVLGPSRLPEFADGPRLPYINALCNECLRWQPVLPLSVPHRSINDDEYRGYFIPAGTVIIQNTWAILHDPEVYPNPDEFRPERFLKNGELYPAARYGPEVAFGAGRRICPGRYFAEKSLFMNVACILQTFNVSAPLDPQGRPIKIEPKMMSGNTHPEPFECVIEPRSKMAEALILGQSKEEVW
ncbi:CyP450 monooxygenase [Obba rivulosa]|uniref:CyP450 monooxygenase n=1 Tax=Obba rivulosa TaxID=1052685 RepID=A0A8E2DMT2_9APHY|nr:CyP450 monooxygenase [Obba rivulosa]